MDQVGQHYPAFWPRFLTWMTDWRGGWHHQWCLQRQKKKKEEDPQPQLRTQRIDLWQKRSALKGVKEWRVELKQPVCRHVLNSEKIKCVREKTCKGRRPLFTPRCHISRWQWPRVTSLGEKGANYSLRCLIIWEFSAIVSERLLKKIMKKGCSAARLCLPFLTTWGLGAFASSSSSGSASHSSVQQLRTVSRDSGRCLSVNELLSAAVSLVGVSSESWLQQSSPKSCNMSCRRVSTVNFF